MFDQSIDQNISPSCWEQLDAFYCPRPTAEGNRTNRAVPSIDRSIVSSIDRSIDRSKKFQQNSQNYLIPYKTVKSDVLGNNY